MVTVLIAVVSLDGRLTRPDESGAGFASAADQKWFQRALLEFDCSVMGRATYDTIAAHAASLPALGRLRVVLTRRPAQAAPQRGRDPAGVEFTPAPPAEVIAGLKTRGMKRCAILGGGQIYPLFLDAGLVDALWLTLEPCVLGGGVPLANGPVRPEHGGFELEEFRPLSASTLLLNYRRPGRPAVRLPAP